MLLAVPSIMLIADSIEAAFKSFHFNIFNIVIFIYKNKNFAISMPGIIYEGSEEIDDFTIVNQIMEEEARSRKQEAGITKATNGIPTQLVKEME